MYSPAQVVILEDDSFPKEEFVPVSGLLSTKWERINQYLSILNTTSCVCTLCLCVHARVSTHMHYVHACVHACVCVHALVCVCIEMVSPVVLNLVSEILMSLIL